MSSILNGAPHKLENIIQFHVGDMVTSLQRAVMQPGGQESIIYGTVMGGIGEPRPAYGRLPATGNLLVSLQSKLACFGVCTLERANSLLCCLWSAQMQIGRVLGNKIDGAMRPEEVRVGAALMALRFRRHHSVPQFLLPVQVPCCP